jgi:hypothetical protein
MKKFKHWLRKHWVVLFIIAIVLALFFATQYFIKSVKESYSEGELRPLYYYHHTDNHGQIQRAPQTVSANDIQPWMTFDYVNVVFKIPPTYLKSILGISDPRYPNIRLDRYAREYSIESSVLLNTVKKYVTTYTASPTSPQATTKH